MILLEEASSSTNSGAPNSDGIEPDKEFLERSNTSSFSGNSGTEPVRLFAPRYIASEEFINLREDGNLPLIWFTEMFR